MTQKCILGKQECDCDLYKRFHCVACDKCALCSDKHEIYFYDDTSGDSRDKVVCSNECLLQYCKSRMSFVKDVKVKRTKEQYDKCETCGKGTYIEEERKDDIDDLMGDIIEIIVQRLPRPKDQKEYDKIENLIKEIRGKARNYEIRNVGEPKKLGGIYVFDKDFCSISCLIKYLKNDTKKEMP